MITEDYVPFEIAKLLKEKGFKEWCRCCYGVAVLHNGEDISFDEECDLKDEGRENEIEYVEGGTFYYLNCNNGDEDTNVWAAPTLQMTMKWLRKVHNLAIGASITVDGWRSRVSRIKLDSEGFIVDIIDGIDDGNIPNCDTYEQACEAAIKYCLENLI